MKAKNSISMILLMPLLVGLTGCTGVSSDAASAGGILVTFSQNFPAIWAMITGFAYVLGIGFVMRAIYYLKVYGESRAMMTTQGSMKVPVILMVVGMALLYLPSTFTIMTNTFFGSTNPLDIQRSGTVSQMSLTQSSALTFQAVLYFVQVVGLVAFIRGWILISHSTQQTHQNVFSKGMTHIVGGILCINIGMWIQIVRNTFGI